MTDSRSYQERVLVELRAVLEEAARIAWRLDRPVAIRDAIADVLEEVDFLAVIARAEAAR